MELPGSKTAAYPPTALSNKADYREWSLEVVGDKGWDGTQVNGTVIHTHNPQPPEVLAFVLYIIKKKVQSDPHIGKL